MLLWVQTHPLAKNIKETKLKFGTLIQKQGVNQNPNLGNCTPHVSFGLEGTVGDLKKGEQYI